MHTPFLRVALLAALLAPGIAVSAGTSSAAAGYDCGEIDTTTQQTYQQMRNLGRAEIAKPPSQGGAYSPPRQASDVSCSPLIALAYTLIDTYAETFSNRFTSTQAKTLLNGWANRRCDALVSERNRVNEIILAPIN